MYCVDSKGVQKAQKGEKAGGFYIPFPAAQVEPCMPVNVKLQEQELLAMLLQALQPFLHCRTPSEHLAISNHSGVNSRLFWADQKSCNLPLRGSSGRGWMQTGRLGA